MTTIIPGETGAAEEVPFIGAAAEQCMAVPGAASAAEVEAAAESFDNNFRIRMRCFNLENDEV